MSPQIFWPMLPAGVETIPIDKTPEELVTTLEAQIEEADATPDNTALLDQLEAQLAAQHALNDVEVPS